MKGKPVKKLKCISNRGIGELLTVGEIYDVIDEEDSMVTIKGDDGRIYMLIIADRFTDVLEPDCVITDRIKDDIVSLKAENAKLKAIIKGLL